MYLPVILYPWPLFPVHLETVYSLLCRSSTDFRVWTSAREHSMLYIKLGAKEVAQAVEGNVEDMRYC